MSRRSCANYAGQNSVVKWFNSVWHVAVAFIVCAGTMTIPASAGFHHPPPAQSWAQQRVALLEASIGAPLPTTLHDVIAFAQVPNADKQQYCLAQAVYFEARGESTEGQAAVARVILNRVGDERYPGTICGVVFQSQKSTKQCQFHFACDGMSDRPHDPAAWETANRIAYMVRENWLPDPIGDSKYFHSVALGKPDWTRKLVQTARLGGHFFYSDKGAD
jgi:hypothetical protein